jgi:DNA mismatch repair ATPase MutL
VHSPSTPNASPFAASSHEYLYVNSRRVSCPQLSILIQEEHSQVCTQLLHSGSHRRRPPKPTWLLLLECPRSAFDITSYEPDGPVIDLIDEQKLLASVKVALLAALESPQPSVAPDRWEAHLHPSSNFTSERHSGDLGGFPVRKKASGGGPDQRKAHAEGSFVTSLSRAGHSREGAGAKSGERGAKRGPTLMQDFAYRPQAAGNPSASSVNKRMREKASDTTHFSPKLQAGVRQNDTPYLPEKTTSWSFARCEDVQQCRPPLHVLGESSQQLPEEAASRSDPGPRDFKAFRLHRGNPSLPLRSPSASYGPADGNRPATPEPRDVGEETLGEDSQESLPAERPSLAALLRSWKNPCIAYSKPITQLQELVEVRSWLPCILWGWNTSA